MDEAVHVRRIAQGDESWRFWGEPRRQLDGFWLNFAGYLLGWFVGWLIQNSCWCGCRRFADRLCFARKSQFEKGISHLGRDYAYGLRAQFSEPWLQGAS